MRRERDEAAAGPGASLVLEGLLAVAKDRRYHRRCQRLVQDVISDPTVSSLENDYDENDNNVPDDDDAVSALSLSSASSASSAASISSLVASIWMALVVWRKGGAKTLGMEACGLEFANAPSTRRRWTAAASIVGAAVSQWYLSPSVHESSRRSEAMSVRRTASRRRGHPHPMDSESLRGEERRQYFEDQRRAMVERSSVAKRRGDSSRGADVAKKHQISRASETSLVSKLLQLARKLAASISAAAEEDYGPHALWNEATSSSSSSSPPSPLPLSYPQRLQALTIGAWIVRLHLAYYCLGGGYASWFHRLFRLPFAPGTGGDRLVHRPTGTPALVGMLIVAQAIGASVPVVAQAMLRYLDRKGLLGSAKAPPPSTRSSIRFVSHPNQLTRPSATPAASKRRTHGGASSSAASSSTTATSSSAGRRICTICRQGRRNPSCPPCGHVFCWTCLQQWLSHRESCPYCRTPCRPQDVLSLYKY